MSGWTPAAEEKRKPKRRERYATDPEFREAKIAAANAWAKANPERRLEGHLRRRYGLTLKEYRSMEAAQKGLCAICRRPETQRHRTSGEVHRLSVDHCHERAAAYLRRDFATGEGR